MKGAVVGFSAQFGGCDAQDAVLPHLLALKRAAVGVSVAGFPAADLSFILRVDGEIQLYGPSGAEHIRVGRNREYISVDIGVSLADRARLNARSKPNPISETLLASVDLLRNSNRKRLTEIDFEALLIAVQTLCRRYEGEIERQA